MPVYNIKVGHKNFKVEISKTSEDSFTIKIGDKIRQVKLKREKESKDSFSVILDGKEYKVEVLKVNRQKPFTIKVDDLDFSVQLQLPERRIVYTGVAAPTISFPAGTKRKTIEIIEGAVTAPMTGKIVSVKVEEGDEVRKGQVLCVLEAMKMENEITAPKSGKVKEIRVSEGTAVNEGDILLIIG